MQPFGILFGYHASDLGNSHIPLALAGHWNRFGLPTELIAPSADPRFRSPWLRTGLGPLTEKLVYRLGPRGLPRAAAERLFRRRMRDSEVVYLWAGLSLDIFRHFAARGAEIVTERINCHRADARARRARFRARWGLTPETGISDEAIATENEKLRLADAIFCPSPRVTESLRTAGIPESKLIEDSYGWSPARFTETPAHPIIRKGEKPRFLFVGSLCARKGIPLLLTAWQKARPDAELILVGGLDEEIRANFGRLLDAQDVKHIPYTRDVGQYYREADIFVFPSLEEGGPMVTYEAMAHGLLPLVSPMGAGAVVRDGQDGTVVPTHEVESWADALSEAARPSSRQVALRRAAMNRARAFTWEKVALRRASALRARFPGLWMGSTDFERPVSRDE